MTKAEKKRRYCKGCRKSNLERHLLLTPSGPADTGQNPVVLVSRSALRKKKRWIFFDDYLIKELVKVE